MHESLAERVTVPLRKYIWIHSAKLPGGQCQSRGPSFGSEPIRPHQRIMRLQKSAMVGEVHRVCATVWLLSMATMSPPDFRARWALQMALQGSVAEIRINRLRTMS